MADKTTGGVAAPHPPHQTDTILVGPTTSVELNTIRAEIIPIACWRIDDIRFEFDSSFLLPDAADELASLAQLVADHPDAPASIFGHGDPVGNDEYNKALSGRRATVLHALLTRQPAKWESIYKDPADHWGLKSIQFMLQALGFDPGNTAGIRTQETTDAIKAFQGKNDLNDDGDAGPLTRGKLIPQYMDAICKKPDGSPFTLQKTEFLGKGADPAGKGDYQGCGEFNPVVMFSKAEDKEFKDPKKKEERNRENAPNRRVLVLLFRPGSVATNANWPCPVATASTAGCRKRLWSDQEKRRTFQENRRTFDDTRDTFACRFYDRLVTVSPCEAVAPPVLIPNTIRLTLDSPWFVPEAEELVVGYTITGPLDQVDRVTMRVVAVANPGTVLFETELPSDTATGTFKWKGDVTPGTFKDFLTLKHSPYQVQLFLDTMFGTTVPSNIEKAEVLPLEIKIRVDDLAVAHVPPSEATAIADLKKEVTSTGKGRLVIVSPVFKVSSAEMKDDSSCTEYESFAGHGPDVPLFAKVRLKGKDGSAKKSPKALFETQILWDVTMDPDGAFTSELDARGVHAHAKTFITKASAFKKDASEPPGRNCHVHLKGFRGTAAEKAASSYWLGMAAAWPLAVPATRTWDGHSGCGEEAGVDDETAVFFLGGRMAGDTYHITAYINHDLTLDVADNAKLQGAPATRRSNKLTWTIWRRVEITKSYKIGASTTELDFGALDKEYNQAAMRLLVAAGLKTEDIQAKWKTEYRNVVTNVFKADKFVQDAAHTDPEDWPVRYRSFMDYWSKTHPGAGFFSKLAKRIHAFFGAADKDTYLKQCDDKADSIYKRVAAQFALGENGLTMFKFPNDGEHNLQADAGPFTAGIAPALAGADRHKSAFLMFKRGKGTDTLIHEVGHMLFLAHAPGHFDPPKQPGGFQNDAHDRTAHDAGTFCLMSYHPSKTKLCGLCQLKLRGWLYTSIKNDGTVT